MNTIQPELPTLRRIHEEEPEMFKFIRVFAEGGRLGKARELFQEELRRILSESHGCESAELKALIAFGQRLFGNEIVDSIVSQCLGAVPV